MQLHKIEQGTELLGLLMAAVNAGGNRQRSQTTLHTCFTQKQNNPQALQPAAGECSLGS